MSGACMPRLPCALRASRPLYCRICAFSFRHVPLMVALFASYVVASGTRLARPVPPQHPPTPRIPEFLSSKDNVGIAPSAVGKQDNVADARARWIARWSPDEHARRDAAPERKPLCCGAMRAAWHDDDGEGELREVHSELLLGHVKFVHCSSLFIARISIFAVITVSPSWFCVRNAFKNAMLCPSVSPSIRCLSQFQ